MGRFDYAYIRVISKISPMWSKVKHILITGGAGFIGSNVVKYALNLGLTVTVLDSFEHAAVSKVSMEEMGAQVLEIDIEDSQSVEQLNVKFDAIIHLAAQVSVPKSIQNPEIFNVTKADRAFPMLVKTLLPVGLKGLVAGGLMAALMSSLASVFN